MRELDRRTFLATLGAGAVGIIACQGRTAPLANAAIREIGDRPGKRKLYNVGIQLYTVRTQVRADLPGTLGRLAQIGYKEIEWWGQHSLTPTQIRAVLDQNGLKSPSVHIGIPRDPAAWTPIFDSARVLGHEWIVAASPPFQPRTPDDWKRLAVAFNEAGKRVKDAGFRFAYHNHTEGMKAAEGVRLFDTVLAETDPALVSFQLDIHWAYAGGADPIELLTKHPRRFRMAHVKDSSGAPDFKQADVGAGTYPWAKVLDAAAKANVEHYFVEHDSPADAMVFAKTSYDYLAKLEF